MNLGDHSIARLLYPWDFPGKNTGVADHSLLLGIFLTLNPSFLGLLHWQADSLPLSHQGSPSRRPPPPPKSLYLLSQGATSETLDRSMDQKSTINKATQEKNALEFKQASL